MLTTKVTKKRKEHKEIFKFPLCVLCVRVAALYLRVKNRVSYLFYKKEIASVKETISFTLAMTKSMF